MSAAMGEPATQRRCVRGNVMAEGMRLTPAGGQTSTARLRTIDIFGTIRVTTAMPGQFREAIQSFFETALGELVGIPIQALVPGTPGALVGTTTIATIPLFRRVRPLSTREFWASTMEVAARAR